MRDDEYFAIKERAAAVLLKIPHVTAVGLGGRERNGQPTGEIVIKVFVDRKRPRDEVPSDELIPASFEGVATDVVEMGPPRLLAPVPGAVAPAAMPMEIVRTIPLRGGIGLTIEGVGEGTMGCLLRDKDDGTAVYGLTNHHVVTNDRLSLSRRIMYPSATPPAFEPIGYPASGVNDKVMDAAIIRIEPDFDWLPAIKEIGFVTGMHDVTVAEAATGTYQVRKRGARTKLTGGVVIAVGVDTPQRKSDIVIRPNPNPNFPPSQQVFFAFRGDSGSAVVNENNEVVGLLYAADINSTSQFVPGFATPLSKVLRRFKDLDKFDLELATAAINATEAAEVRRVIVPGGAPLLSGNDILAKGDHHYSRPLSGGAQLLAEPMLGAVNSTTLGCIVTQVADPDTAYVLTSFSGVSANGTLPPTTDTDVGQPDNDSSCSGCCSNTIGEFAAASDSAQPTHAIVKVKDDQKWLAEIMQIGLIDSIAAIDPFFINRGDYQVRKRGAGTRLTGGIVTAVGGVAGTLPPGVRADAMIVRPNPNPSRPGQAICFSHLVDRGALVVNSFNQVVGILYDEVDIPDGGVTIRHGVAMPMQIVLDALKNVAHINVVMATANAPDVVHTTNTRTMTEIDASTLPLIAPASGQDLVTELPDEISHSLPGRLAIALWIDHRAEIRHLIDHNRKVATVWHRSGGPALLQAAIRAYHTPSLTLPATINGLPIADCVARIASVFRKHGSASLQSDIDHLYSVLPPLANRSLRDLVAGLAPA
jgi:hypothetical protein